MVKGVAGSGGVRLPNDALGGANDGCVGVAEFWVLVFVESRVTSASTGDGVDFS